MIHLPSIKDIKTLQGKKIFVRVDFNVSLKHGFQITDDTRIVEALPTIRYLAQHGAKVLLLSHFGRPKGMKDPEFSLQKVLPKVIEHLGPVRFIDDFGNRDSLRAGIEQLKDGGIALVENTRFHPGEVTNDPVLAKSIAEFGDYFVMDAFGAAHRAHASTVGLAQLLPSYAGFLLEKEVSLLSHALSNPQRPFLVIIGGAKTIEKIRVVDRLLDIANTIYLGGAVANTFFATWGVGVGVSKVDHEMIEMARSVFWKATRAHSRLILPNDVIVSNSDRTTEPFAVSYDKIPGALGIFDLGPQARAEIVTLINESKTIIWNGPMGLYEDERFKAGTATVLSSIAAQQGKTTIVGGGDTLTTIDNRELLSNITHVSTGGAAMLEFLEKGTLPAIEVLRR